MRHLILFSIAVLFPGALLAQDDLLELANEEAQAPGLYVEQTFKGTRLINGHSIETRSRGVLDVIISHRFGRLNSGGYELFGLDESNVRLGVDYGVTDQFNIGIGRNSFEKTYDGFLKYKFLRQGLDPEGTAPVSIAAFSGVALKTLRVGTPDNGFDASERMAYTLQLIIARKFSPALSLQFSPAFVHHNTVAQPGDPNSQVALGGGGRIKLTSRVSLNAEYYAVLNRPAESPGHNALAIGFDIETGGHVFQLHFTNSRAMTQKGFMTETYGDFFDGDIHFGFNISRVFELSGE